MKWVSKISKQIAYWFGAIDFVLRQGRDCTGALRTNRPSLRLILIFCIALGASYGAGMGSYGFWIPATSLATKSSPLLQMVFSGAKVPLLVLVTLSIALPSFFVLNTLLGLRDDWKESCRAVISAQAIFTLVLFSLLPITLFWYGSREITKSHYSNSVLFNAFLFFIASLSAQWVLIRNYRPLITKNSRHRITVRAWLFLYAFIGIQAAYCLRPFVGSPNLETSLFRRDSFQNAYVRVWGMFLEFLQSL